LLNPFALQFLLFDLSPVRFLCSFGLLTRVVLYRVLHFKHSESAYVLELVHSRGPVSGLGRE